MRIPTRGGSSSASITLIVIAIALVVGCGAAGSAAAPGDMGGPQAVGAGARTGGQPDEGGSGEGLVGGEPGTDGFAPRDDARIVRTGSLQLDVVDVRDAVTRGRDLATSLGGYIGASQQYTYDGTLTASVSYRIPNDRWQAALDGFGAIGELVSEETNAIEVTDQVVDLEARIRNLKASETALVRHATNAERIADLLEIESRLSDVRGQIEQLTAQLTNLEDRAAYATLDVTYGTELAAIEIASREWDPKAEVDRASASLVGVLQALTNAGIWFAIVWLPVLLLLGVLIAVAYVVARRLGLIRRNRPPLAPPPEATPA
ncbi:MAG TPA: DUF4349 domain-containing protein [Candidatus Limnocylindrales bacterium]